MATIYKRGETYWLKWYKDGKAKYESLKTKDKKKALTAKAAKELELHTGAPKASDVNCTVAEFARRYLLWRDTEYASGRHIENLVERSIVSELGGLRMADLDSRIVEDWKRRRKSNPSPTTGKPRSRTTVNLELAQLKAMAKKAVEWGVLREDPLIGVKRFKSMSSGPKRFFTLEELEQLYAAAPDKAPLWKLLANTGMRVSEAYNLKWENVTAHSIRVVSNENHPTKSRRWREVPMSPGCREALSELDHDRPYVLPSRRPRTYQRWFQLAREAVGIEGRVHDLRHTFISHLVMQGVPLRTVQVLAGHSSITVTENYSHLAPDYMAAAVSGLSL